MPEKDSAPPTAVANTALKALRREIGDDSFLVSSSKSESLTRFSPLENQLPDTGISVDTPAETASLRVGGPRSKLRASKE
jgi:hypothetical protein